MKVVFTAATFAIIYQMRFVRSIKGSYDRDRDTFRYEILVAGAILISLFVHERISNRGPIHWLVEVRFELLSLTTFPPPRKRGGTCSLAKN
jgi:ER lumen protein retaining receptor